MANERAVTAESVGNVLEIARMRRQSGRFFLEQRTGGRVLEGEIHVQGGQAIYARLGTLSGEEAFNRLLTWRNISVIFRSDESEPLPSVPGRAGSTGPVAVPVQASALLDRAESNDGARGGGYAPGIEWLVPQKRSTEHDVLSLPLTRPQRFIYFLVDGRRTVSDLSRCTGKNIQEIELILRELQTQGLVNI
jgi:hypothetical protein